MDTVDTNKNGKISLRELENCIERVSLRVSDSISLDQDQVLYIYPTLRKYSSFQFNTLFHILSCNLYDISIIQFIKILEKIRAEEIASAESVWENKKTEVIPPDVDSYCKNGLSSHTTEVKIGVLVSEKSANNEKPSDSSSLHVEKSTFEERTKL